jgi:hypothetical protein
VGRFKSVAVLLAFTAIVPVSALAGPIHYSFTGVMSADSTLTLNNGTVVDLSSVPFSATGIVGDLADGATSVFRATTTYDFGALGAFTTDEGADRYAQFSSTDGTSVSRIGLISWRPGSVDLIGFLIAIGNVPVTDIGMPVALGNVNALRTLTDRQRFLENSVGQTLHIDWNSHKPNVTITSAAITAVPEPSTLLLLGLGALGAAGLTRRSNPRRLFSPGSKTRKGTAGAARGVGTC